MSTRHAKHRQTEHVLCWSCLGWCVTGIILPSISLLLWCASPFLNPGFLSSRTLNFRNIKFKSGVFRDVPAFIFFTVLSAARVLQLYFSPLLSHLFDSKCHGFGWAVKHIPRKNSGDKAGTQLRVWRDTKPQPSVVNQTPVLSSKSFLQTNLTLCSCEHISASSDGTQVPQWERVRG